MMLVLLFFFVGWGGASFAEPHPLKMSDIHRVFERLFSFHIEAKDFNPTIARRSIRLFIEQFDPDKTYLLADEVTPYLQLSDRKAQEIIERLKKEDYSDFLALNALFQRAIYRAESMRSMLAQQLLEEDPQEGSLSPIPSSRYASSEAELAQRQKLRMARFFIFQKGRTHLDSPERKAKVFSLFERKVRRTEANFLFQDLNGNALPKAKIDHFIATKILKSFAKSLDTHTSFFSPEEAYEMRLSLEKQFEGVGVVLSEGIDGVMIAELIKGSPAEESGKIQINDLLVEVNGTPVSQLSFEEVLDLLKQKDAGEMVLGFRRVDLEVKNESFYRVALKKRPILMNEERIETSYEKFGQGIIGKIVLHSFYESGDGISSEKDIKEAIAAFREKGDLHGLVLDLRENSGGFLSQAVKVAGLFMSNGVVVISKYGKGDLHYLRNIVSRPVFNGPLIILVSKMSASAAEIVAQALQDYGIAVVVGDERTFGKGSIQYQTVTDEKADIFFKVTVGRYYTASGRSTQIDGVISDIQVPTQYAPYNIGERFLEYPLPADAVGAAYIDPLTDLDQRTKLVFQKRYLPSLQRIVPYWKRILPQLQKNSRSRITKNPDFQAFLKHIDKIRSRQGGLPVNTIDEPIHIGMEDLQMSEAVNIVKDMILIESQDRPKVEAPAASLAPTGTE
ncbi:MAG: PDZ domain-containing protein [Verrucomicrobiota bacterium]|nr:PDZ domain-containing protein [Verrucomicrobiota bacterium]